MTFLSITEMALQIPSPTTIVDAGSVTPLTTTFTPPPSCLSDYYIRSMNPTAADYYLVLDHQILLAVSLKDGLYISVPFSGSLPQWL